MKKFILKLFFIIFILIIIAGAIGTWIGFSYYSSALKEKPLITRVEEITSQENYTSFNQIPTDYINALVAIEDHRFYSHSGVDLIGIARAMYTNIRDGKFDEGGSTITQQVAKNIVFNQEQNIVRKLGEIFAARDLEKNYTKDEIIALYANVSYFGDGYYCIYDASQGYFNKEPKDLNLDECSMLAGIVNAPSIYSPSVNLELCKQRQAQVLNAMVKYKYISQNEAYEIINK